MNEKPFGGWVIEKKQKGRGGWWRWRWRWLGGHWWMLY